LDSWLKSAESGISDSTFSAGICTSDAVLTFLSWAAHFPGVLEPCRERAKKNRGLILGVAVGTRHVIYFSLM
jgi:hypothetical protein